MAVFQSGLRIVTASADSKLRVWRVEYAMVSRNPLQPSLSAPHASFGPSSPVEIIVSSLQDKSDNDDDAEGSSEVKRDWRKDAQPVDTHVG